MQTTPAQYRPGDYFTCHLFGALLLSMVLVLGWLLYRYFSTYPASRSRRAGRSPSSSPPCSP